MKKYILILLLFTGFLQAQTLQNPTFGNTTTNTLKIKTPATVTSVNFLSTNEADGSISKISPINVNIPYTPSNYTISNQSIGEHLTGIDTRLGQISSTTAGITQRVYFTADNTTVTAGTFFTSSLTGKGSTATGSPPALVLADNTKGYFTKDIISVAFPASTIGYAGSYTGQLTVSATPTPVATQQRFTVEIYRTDNGGTPIASGVSGAPTGALGVTVVAILDSGILNLTAGSITNIPITGILTQNITLNTGERLRYHVSAAKIGSGGGSVTFGVYYGSSYNSYYDVPVAITTDAVLNKSSVTGVTGTDALNNLNILKANLWEVETLTPVVGGQNTRIAFRKGENQNRGFPLMVYFHGAGGNQNDPFTDPDQKRIVDQFIQAGYMVASSNGAGDSWGNQAGIDAYDDLITHITNTYNITKIVLIGQSMGGLVSLNLMSTTSHKIDAWYGIYPATNLKWCFDNGFGVPIKTAYGFTNDADFDTATAGHDPNIKNVSLFPKIKYRFVASTGDTVIGITDNTTMFNSKITGRAIYNDIVLATGDHGDPTHFILDDAITFSSKSWETFPTAITADMGTSSVQVANTEFVQNALSGKQDIITNPVTGTGANGLVPFWTGLNSQIGDINLYWDNANKRLGIGTNVPTRSLEVKDGLRINGSSATIDFGDNFNNQIWNDASTFNIKSGGSERLIINKSTGKATFTQPLIIPNATNANEAVNLGQLNAAIPAGIKRYKALISQSGTSAPTVTVLENSLGTVTYNYTSAGEYTANSSGLFTSGKTFLFLNPTYGTGNYTSIKYNSNNVLDIKSLNGLTPTDGILSIQSLLIEVYP